MHFPFETHFTPNDNERLRTRRNVTRSPYPIRFPITGKLLLCSYVEHVTILCVLYCRKRYCMLNVISKRHIHWPRRLKCETNWKILPVRNCIGQCLRAIITPSREWIDYWNVFCTLLPELKITREYFLFAWRLHKIYFIPEYNNIREFTFR